MNFLENSRAEIRAVSLLILILTLSIVFPRVWEVKSPQHLTQPTVLYLETDISGHQDEPGKKSQTSKTYPKPDPRTAKPRYTPAARERKPKSTHIPTKPCSQFDPNTIETDSLRHWGISPQAANNLGKYRESGGRFYRKTDLLKVYGLDSVQYKRIATCINLGESTRHLTRLDINLADSSQLVKLKGIGPVLASRFIKFRNALGGFAAVDQVSEIYGLPPETYNAIRATFVLEAPWKEFNINTLSAYELAIHPYISYKQAKTIEAYIRNHGTFTNSTELAILPFADSVWLGRLEPYLTFPVEANLQQD